jgi:hypothetical protein
LLWAELVILFDRKYVGIDGLEGGFRSYRNRWAALSPAFARNRTGNLHTYRNLNKDLIKIVRVRLGEKAETMTEVANEIEEARGMTLQGLEESEEALDVLKQECSEAAHLMMTDMAKGAGAIPRVVDAIHQFIVFEQQILDLFEVDSTTILLGSDSLWQVELDMHDLLVEFSNKSDETDFVGVAQLLGNEMNELLTRFQSLLPVLREHIENGGVE